jgi:hypothetical protein
MAGLGVEGGDGGELGVSGGPGMSGGAGLTASMLQAQLAEVVDEVILCEGQVRAGRGCGWGWVGLGDGWGAWGGGWERGSLQISEQRKQLSWLRTALGDVSEAAEASLAEVQLGWFEVRAALGEHGAAPRVQHALQRVGGAWTAFRARQDAVAQRLSDVGVPVRLPPPAAHPALSAPLRTFLGGGV